MERVLNFVNIQMVSKGANKSKLQATYTMKLCLFVFPEPAVQHGVGPPRPGGRREGARKASPTAVSGVHHRGEKGRYYRLISLAARRIFSDHILQAVLLI